MVQIQKISMMLAIAMITCAGVASAQTIRFPAFNIICKNSDREILLDKSLEKALIVDSEGRRIVPVEYRHHTGGRLQTILIKIVGLDVGFHDKSYIEDLDVLAANNVSALTRVKDLGFGTEVVETLACTYTMALRFPEN